MMNHFFDFSFLNLTCFIFCNYADNTSIESNYHLVRKAEPDFKRVYEIAPLHAQIYYVWFCKNDWINKITF